MKYKDCRRTSTAIIEGIHNKLAEENFSKTIRKWKIQEIERTHNKIVCHKLQRFLKRRNPPALEMQNKNLMMTLTRELPLTPLINKPPHKVNDVGMDRREPRVVEEMLYQVAENYFIRTETVIHTRAIRIQREEKAENILQVNNVCLLYTSRCV